MSVVKIKCWLASLCVLALVGCGGGGDAGTPLLSDSGSGSGGGTTTGAASVVLALSSSTITAVSPVTVTVTVRDAKGVPISGVVVDLKTVRGNLVALNVASVATDITGTGTAVLTALAGGVSGADELVGVAKLGTTTVDGAVGFTVAVNESTIGLTISSTTLRASTGLETLRALVKNIAGQPVPDIQVSFVSLGGRVKLGASTAKTDSQGIATVTVTVVDSTLTAADTIAASANVNGADVRSSLVVQLVADVPTLMLTASNSVVTSAAPVTLSILVSDAAGRPVGAGTVVSLNSSFGLTSFSASSVTTNVSGVAQIIVTPRAASSNGSDQVVASATVGGSPVSSQVVLQVSSAATATVSVFVLPNLITTAAPGVVSIAVRNAQGNAVAGAVVALSTVRGNFASLSVASVATDSNGNATAVLSALGGGRGGADQVVASVSNGTTNIQGSGAFTVAGTSATMGITITSTTLRASTGFATLSAQVRDAIGNAVANSQVAFASAGGHVRLGATSAMTDAAGIAKVTVTVADPSLTVADTLTASASVGSQAVQSSLVVQVLADSPTLTVTSSSATASVAAPAILSVLVKDASGLPVGAGSVVSFGSVFGLSAFDATTTVTNASGIAQVAVTPRTATSNGADQITAISVVGGVTVATQTVLQIQSSSTALVTVGVSSAMITRSSPATVTVTVRDARGSPLAGAVVDLSTVRGNLATLNQASVATDVNGIATATLTAVSGGPNGADQVLAVARVGALSVQGIASFTVAGGVSTVGLTISTTTLRGSTGPANLKATVKDAAGNPVPNLLVVFNSAAGRVVLSASSAMTDSLGEARVSATVADAGVTAADTLTATATVGSGTVQSSLVVQLLADTPTIKITPSVTNVTASTFATLSIAVKDGAGNAVGAGTVVSVSSTFGLSAFDASTAVTNASGIAQVVVSPKSATSNGADRIVAVASVGGVTASDQTVLQIQSTTTTSVTVAVSSSLITSASSATVTVTVRDASGNPVPGTVVDLSTVRGNLANLSASSVFTGSAGTATSTLSANRTGSSGADQVVGVVRLGTTTAQGSVGFTVSAGAPTINLTISSTTLRGSTGAVVLSAVVRDAAGNFVSNAMVSFASAGGRVRFDAPSAVTNASGLATVNVVASDPSAKAADTLTAAATVDTVAVQSALAVQVMADTPSISISAPSSSVTAAAPATLSISVRDTNGVAVGAGTIVNITSSYGLSAFDATTVSTNASGIAQVTVTPKSPSSNGADQVVASTTVGGVAITTPFVVQVSSSTLTAPPVLTVALTPSTSISSAAPATITASLKDGRGLAVAGEVVTFTVVRGLAVTNVATALTDSNGAAVVTLSPASSTTAGADEVSATVTYAGTTLKSTKGFQIQATNVTLGAFTSAVPSLGAYGQTTLTLAINGAAVGSPVNVSVSSSCVSLGKATLSPATFVATTASVSLQYKDNGCGALQIEDKLQASVVGGSGMASLTLPIAPPSATSVAFLTASPEVIYIKGSGFTETSTLTFEVRDGAGNVLPNRGVLLSLLTRSGGVTIEGGTADVTQTSDATGKVTVRVTAGTIPTPIRVSASLVGAPTIATVSSNLSVSVGLPSQLNFSLSQATRNIEGFNLDGTPNSYTLIASDRNGNPVPNGTSINFITEGGQIQPIVRTTGSPAGVSVSAVATAQFQSSSPRPPDGRVTVTAYALGEESFIDLNGNNVYDLGEPFQDLGDLFKDRNFDGVFDPSLDEFIPTDVANSSACVVPASPLLALDPSIPSKSAPFATCSGTWSGAGKVYVRRAVETVMATSAARTLWGNTSGLDISCRQFNLQVGPQPTQFATVTAVGSGEVWYGNGSSSLSLSFIVADANTFSSLGPNSTVGRLNPMAALTTVSVSTPTDGMKVVVAGGSPVPSTTEATTAAIAVTFETATSGVVFVTFTSPVSKTATTYAINVQKSSAGKVGSCP